MDANQINLIDVAWTTGYVIGQLPSQLILTKVRPSVWIPSCELVWTILTFCLAAATTSNQVIGIRFFVGLVESIFYPAAHFLIGSWYKPSELGKRACVFHASAAVAGIFSGYLQAAVYTGLNGAAGKAGWQWLFIMDGLISLPICIAGFFFIPDLPENTRAFYLSAEDATLARKRMADIGRAPRKKLGWSILKRVFTRWHVYALTTLYIIFINNGPSSSVSPLSLWLKANGWPVTLIVSSPPSHFLSLLMLVEYHPNGQKCGPTSDDTIVCGPQRLLPQTRSYHVHRNFLRVLLRSALSNMEHSSRPKVVCFLFLTCSHSLWTSCYVLGQRNLFFRRRGTGVSVRHYE